MITIKENGLNIVFDKDTNGELCLLHLGENEFDESLVKEESKHACRAIEIQLTGESHRYHHGLKNVGALCGEPLCVTDYTDTRNEKGRKIEFLLQNDKIKAVLHYQLYDGIKAVRSWADVTNIGNSDIGIEYISSFSLYGIDKEGVSPVNDKLEIMIPFNTWSGELAWQCFSPEQLGYNRIRSMQLRSISASCMGMYCTNGYLPMGYIRNSDINHGMIWQIENHGPWQWEISDFDDMLYLKLSGPNENTHHFWKKLAPNDSFTSCKCGVAVSSGGFDEALCELTKYRRQIVRKNEADSSLPVIFNDYLKCMLCNATEQKLRPVIEKAEQIGCEYFMMDAGWYCKNNWELEGGEWFPDPDRFPNGIESVTDYIRAHNMKPGIWLEPEIIGEQSPMKDRYSDDCFFIKHGKRTRDNFRYMLDFRNKEVTDYLTGVVDRFYNQYGVRYLKLDCNIEIGAGTELNADSMGEGLMGHNNAYSDWVRGLLDKYPELIIENCSSGGLRMTYGLLDKCTIQSVTDQEDYTVNGIVASKTATALLPEQAGIWIYPSADTDKYEVTYNMVNAMLNRMHVSGAVAQMSDEMLDYMKEAITYYKKIRHCIKSFLPFYPLGLAGFYDNWAVVGYRADNRVFLGVWRRESEENTIDIPLKMQVKNLRIAYPDFEENSAEQADGGIRVCLGHINSACIIEADICD